MGLDDDTRLDALMRLAAQSKIDRIFFKIDTETCRIIDVIGNIAPDFPMDIIMNATPETFIPDKVSQAYCRTAICLVHESQEPITTKLTITISGKTALETIHFRPGRSGRGDTPTTIIAHQDKPLLDSHLYF